MLGHLNHEPLCWGRRNRTITRIPVPLSVRLLPGFPSGLIPRVGAHQKPLCLCQRHVEHIQNHPHCLQARVSVLTKPLKGRLNLLVAGRGGPRIAI